MTNPHPSVVRDLVVTAHRALSQAVKDGRTELPTARYDALVAVRNEVGRVLATWEGPDADS